jgi:hypothetical protein
MKRAACIILWTVGRFVLAFEWTVESRPVQSLILHQLHNTCGGIGRLLYFLRENVPYAIGFASFAAGLLGQLPRHAASRASLAK